ncbi:MAG: hypothetical protein L3J39_15040 [Verrucomicrobiales bacterium]|nr:hypothetical protein [Verrucomicrobiales bacterium]
MSLKQFHIVFILTAVTLSVGFAVWAFTRYQPQGGVLFMGGVSCLAAVALSVYGVWFLKKLKGQEN